MLQSLSLLSQYLRAIIQSRLSSVIEMDPPRFQCICGPWVYHRPSIRPCLIELRKVRLCSTFHPFSECWFIIATKKLGIGPTLRANAFQRYRGCQIGFIRLSSGELSICTQDISQRIRLYSRVTKQATKASSTSLLY